MVTTMQTGIYRHYKNGQLYHVIGIALHSESLEEMVVYRCLYGNYGLWVRPYAMFKEYVTIDGESIPRFSFLHSVDNAPTVD